MPILDFKEIPEANKATGEQDTFELFARDFLEYFGYKIILGPDRGPDGGRDIIALEIRKGVGGETTVKWLVSCKHFAYTGKSVSAKNEDNIIDRVMSKECQGFLGFYSTIPHASLTERLEGLKNSIEYQIFDKEKIEKELLGSSEGMKIAERYFHISTTKWKQENPKPAKLFSDQTSLHCEYCKKDLLEPTKTGIVVLLHKLPVDRSKDHNYEIVDIYWCCKGNCDRILRKHYKSPEIISTWADISDVCIPYIYLRTWIMGTINNLVNKEHYSPDAFTKLKDFLITIFPHVSRHLTTEEEERVDALLEIPDYLGGLGKDY